MMECTGYIYIYIFVGYFWIKFQLSRTGARKSVTVKCEKYRLTVTCYVIRNRIFGNGRSEMEIGRYAAPLCGN